MQLPLLNLPVGVDAGRERLLRELRAALHAAGRRAEEVDRLRRVRAEEADRLRRAASESQRALEAKLAALRGDIDDALSKIPPVVDGDGNDPRFRGLSQAEARAAFQASTKVLGSGAFGETRLVTLDGDVVAVCKKFEAVSRDSLREKRRVLMDATKEFRRHFAVWSAVNDACRRNMTRPFNMQTKYDPEVGHEVLDAYDHVGYLPADFYTVQGSAAGDANGHADSVQNLFSHSHMLPQQPIDGLPCAEQTRERERRQEHDDRVELRYAQLRGVPGSTDEFRDGLVLAARLGAMTGHAMACAHRAGYVHGDLGAQNIMLQFAAGDADMTNLRKCSVVFIDWGLSRPLSDRVSDWNPHDLALWVRAAAVYSVQTYPAPAVYSKPKIHYRGGDSFAFDQSQPTDQVEPLELMGLSDALAAASGAAAIAAHWGLLRAYEHTLRLPHRLLNYVHWPMNPEAEPSDKEFMPAHPA